MPRLVLARSCAALALLAAAPAAAQSIDYGSLETLFGEPVTTSATGKPQRASEAPVAMDIVTQEQIRRSGLTNLAEIIARLVGVDAWYDGPQSSSFGIRGFSTSQPQELLVLVNGRQVYTDIDNMVPWSAIPVQPHEIRQIEVVRGPNTALFGLNAVAGVINIVTYNPLYDKVNSVSGRLGTHDHREVSAVATLPFGKLGGVRISAGHVESDTFDSIRNAPVESPIILRPKRSSVMLDSLVQIAPHVQAGAELSWAKSEQNDRDPNAFFASNFYEVKAAKLSLAAETDLGLTEAVAYRNIWNWEVNLGGLQAILSPLPYDQELTLGRVQHLFKPSPAHTLRAAAEYRYNEGTVVGTDYNATGLIRLPGIGFNYDLYAGSLMWDWAVDSNLTINNAVRIDHLSTERTGPPPPRPDRTNADYARTITTWSFNSGLTYQLSAEDSLRVNASRGVQLPSLFAMGLFSFRIPVPLAPGFQIDLAGTGNPDVEPSILMNYEAGWTRKLSWIAGELAVNAFYQQISDLVDSAPGQFLVGPSGLPFVLLSYDNVGKGDVYGLEAELSGAFGKGWSWGLNYTYRLTNDDFKPYPGVDNIKIAQETGFEEQNPEHIANARLGWAAGDWTVDLYGQYRSAVQRFSPEQPAFSPPAQQAAYLVFDGRIAYRINEIFSVEASGQSLNRSGFKSAHNFEYERRLFLGVTADF